MACGNLQTDMADRLQALNRQALNSPGRKLQMSLPLMLTCSQASSGVESNDAAHAFAV
jgi:hypothetical protein